MSTFVAVNQCRFCGAIIPSSKGAENHGEVCRFLDKISANANLFQAMITVNFPCPLVIIKRLIRLPKPGMMGAPCEENDKDPQLQQTSSLRAMENVRRGRMSSTNEDNDQEMESEDELLDFSDTDNSTESENDRHPKPSSSSLPASKAKVSSNGKYPCPYKGCGSKLTSVFKLKEHFLIHLENSPFACPYPGCKNRKRSGKWEFKVHIDWHEGKNLKRCDKCGRILSKRNRQKWETHICKSGFRKGKQVKDVPAGFYDTGQYSRYLEGKNGDQEKAAAAVKELLRIQQTKSYTEIIASDPVFLEVCKDNPGFKELILRNHKPANRNKKFKCSKCDKCYGKMELLRNHILSSHTNRPWRCAKCGRTFLKIADLKTHMKIHIAKSSANDMYMRREDNGVWSCTKCEFQSKYDKSMRRHLRVMHDVDVLPPRKIYQTKEISQKKLVKSSSESDLERDEKTDFPVSVDKFKIESEPPLELVMIKAEDMKVDCNVKQEDIF